MAIRIRAVEEVGGDRVWVLYEEGSYHRPLALVPDPDMARLFADYQEIRALSTLRADDPDLLSRTVDQVPWPSARARKALRTLSWQRGLRGRLLTLGELIGYTSHDFLALKNIGLGTVSAIRETLAGLGLKLGGD
jgi:hypothetical protein